MNPRERFAAITNFREADRVPIDWGRHVGSIHRNGYVRLKQYLGDPALRNEDAVLDRMVQNVYPDEKLLERFHVDFRWLEPNWVDVQEVEGEDAYIDMWGIKWIHMLNAYSLAESPLAEAAIEDVDRHPWPDPYNPQIFAGLAARAKHLYDNTDYVIVADSIKGGLLTKALQICGYQRMFSALAGDRAFAEAVLDKLLWLYKEMWTGYMQAVGPYVQMVYFTDDIGAQNNMLISPDLFRSLIKPRLKELFGHIKGLGDVKLSYHTDGSVVPVIGDIIEMNVDILNPIQTSAMGMDTYVMKETYGDRLVFHGAIDVQQMLPFSTPEEVRYDVAKRIWDLGRGGGFILSSCHDVGEDVPPANVVAMFEAAWEYGVYPLSLADVLKPEDLNPVVAEAAARPTDAPAATKAAAADDVDLTEEQEDILDEIYEHTLNGDAEPVRTLTDQGLQAGMGPLTLLFDGLIPALEEVGRLFEEGSYFVPEMLISATAMSGAMDILKPLIAETGAKPVGTFLMGTVRGDIHDIGKNLCNIMLEGAGFRVIDLGVNVSEETFVEAVREHQPDAVGMSAFLTTTIPMFKPTIAALEAAGLRQDVKIFVGGAPVTAEYAQLVGADGYAPNASALVREVKAALGIDD